jgi:uncharacterized OsmC-like protein
VSTTTESPIRNGVDTAALFGTINHVKQNRDLAAFQFRATNTWMRGTHSRTSIMRFAGAGQELSHNEEFVFDTDHPEVLTGTDHGPTPVEMLLGGLAGCLTAGIANIAAARRVTLRSVESTVEGDIDLQGILGLSSEVRNGYRAVRVTFRIDADAPAETVREIVEQSKARSAVLDVLSHGVPVDVSVNEA